MEEKLREVVDESRVETSSLGKQSGILFFRQPNILCEVHLFLERRQLSLRPVPQSLFNLRNHSKQLIIVVLSGYYL